jgi:hypothetical protein
MCLKLAKAWDFLKVHNGPIWPTVAFGLLIAAGIVVLWKDVPCNAVVAKDMGPRHVTTILLFLWIGWIYAWVIHCFAGDAYAQRSRSIQFAYFFVILSFVAVSIMIANIDRASSFGVVEGCVDSSEETAIMPIRCDYPARLRVAVAEPAPTTPVAELPFAVRSANALTNHNFHHLLNIGGRLDKIPGSDTAANAASGCPARMIRGGVPVPVYFILLALIGAAISLARNVPVIQRRSEDGYVATAIESRLTPGEVRELLAFQILQFVSAPFLAVAAYHTLKPESLATTVALGFLTGFASESILALLSVRGKTLKEPPEASAVLNGQVYGKVKMGGDVVAGAEVAIGGLDKLKPVRTGADGSFKFVGVPVSPQPYELTATGEHQGVKGAGAIEVVLKTPTERNAGDIQLTPQAPPAGPVA